MKSTPNSQLVSARASSRTQIGTTRSKEKKALTMETSKKTNRFNLDDIGMTFVVVAWGGMLLSVFSQAI